MDAADRADRKDFQKQMYQKALLMEQMEKARRANQQYDLDRLGGIMGQSGIAPGQEIPQSRKPAGMPGVPVSPEAAAGQQMAFKPIAGTGMGSSDPVERVKAAAQAGALYQQLAPAYTGLVSAPAELQKATEVQKLKSAGDLAKQQQEQMYNRLNPEYGFGTASSPAGGSIPYSTNPVTGEVVYRGETPPLSPELMEQARKNNLASAGVDVTKKTKGTLEGDLIKTRYALHELEAIDEATDPYFLTMKGQLDSGLARIADYIGLPSERQRGLLTDKVTMRTTVGRVFDAYRKNITGAQAALDELRRLEKNLLSMSMTPTEFEAAKESYKATLKRALTIQLQLLTEGLNPESEEYQTRADDMFLSSTTSAQTPGTQDELPPGFEKQPDGTALNPETGQRLKWRD